MKKIFYMGSIEIVVLYVYFLRIDSILRKNKCVEEINMSHFAYACKMRCPLNLVLEKSEYLWFY